MTQVHPTNTPPPAKHAPEPGRIVQEVAPPFTIRPREKSKAQTKSSNSAEESSDENKLLDESRRVLELAAAFSNNDEGGGNGGGRHHNPEADIAPPAPPQPNAGPADAPPPAAVPAPVPSTTPSSEEDDLAAELAALGEDPGIFELMLPGGANLAVAIESSGRALSFFLSTDNDPLGKKLKSKKKELATSLERRMGRSLNLIVL